MKNRLKIMALLSIATQSYAVLEQHIQVLAPNYLEHATVRAWAINHALHVAVYRKQQKELPKLDLHDWIEIGFAFTILRITQPEEVINENELQGKIVITKKDFPRSMELIYKIIFDNTTGAVTLRLLPA